MPAGDLSGERFGRGAMVYSGAVPEWAMALRILRQALPMLNASLPRLVAAWHHWQRDDAAGYEFDFPPAR